jgi:hypothetical protein
VSFAKTAGSMICRKRTSASVVGLFVILSGCSSIQVPAPLAGADTDAGGARHEIVLYVSNQTYEIDPVDILVTVDRRIVAQGKFQVGDGHNWRKFAFSVPDGRHQIIASSQRGKAMLDVICNVRANEWLVLNYWGRGHLQLGFYEEAVIFE